MPLILCEKLWKISSGVQHNCLCCQVVFLFCEICHDVAICDLVNYVETIFHPV